MAITWEDYLAKTAGSDTKTDTLAEQIWDDADSSQNLRLEDGDAPEIFHDITPTGDTKNERSKVYKQIAQLNNIPIEEAIKQVDAEAEAAKVDPNLGLRLKSLRAAGKFDGPITSHEIYQLGKEATAATDETEVGKFDDRQNILDAVTSFNDNQAKLEITPDKSIDDLEKGFFSRGLLKSDITNEMIAKGYMAPGADPTTETGRKQYELQLKAAEKAKRLGIGLWEDPTQAKIMESIVDTSYSQGKYLDQVRAEGKSDLTGIETIDETLDTIQSATMKVGAGALGLVGKGLKTAGEYNKSEANKKGKNYLMWDKAILAGEYLDDLGTRATKNADAYFGANGSEGQMVANVTEELMKGNFGNVVDEVTLKESVKLVAGMAPYVVGMMSGSGQAGLWASIANEGIEEAKNESKDGTISKERTYAVLGASALSLGLEKLGIDAIFKGKTPAMISKLIPKNIQSELAKKLTSSAGLIAVETLTEPIQELLVILSTQVGQKDGGLGKELERVLTNPENIKRLAESAVGGTLAGGTVRAPLDGPGIAVATSKATLGAVAAKAGKMSDKRKASNLKKYEAKIQKERTDSVNNQEMEFGKDPEEVTAEKMEIVDEDGNKSEVTVFESMDELKSKSKSAEEFVENLEDQKIKVVQSVYTIDKETGKINGLTDQAKTLSPTELDAKVAKVDKWMNDYAQNYTTEVDGVAQPIETAQAELDAVVGEESEAKAFIAEHKGLSQEKIDKIAKNKQLVDEEISALESVIEDAEEGSEKAAKEAKIAELATESRKLGEELTVLEADKESVKRGKKTTDEMAKDVAEFGGEELKGRTFDEKREFFKKQLEDSVRIVEDGKVKGYARGWSSTRVKYAAEMAAKEHDTVYGFNTNEEVSVETDYDGLLSEAISSDRKGDKDKVASARGTTGAELADVVIKGDMNVKDSSIKVNENSSKAKKRIVEYLQGYNKGNPKANEIVKAAMRKIVEVANSESGKKLASKVFNETGMNNNDAIRLIVNAVGAVQSAVVTDTQQRLRIPENTNQEYMASYSNLITQIGKDYYTSRGLKVKGSPLAVAEQYREMGQVGMDLAIEAGLLKKTDGELDFVLTDKMTNVDGSPLDSHKGRISTTSKDPITGDSIKTYSDFGVQVVESDNSNKYPNQISNGITTLEYQNGTGDALNRLNKLLVPSNYAVPMNSPSNYVHVAPTINPYKNKEKGINEVEIVRKLQQQPHKLKKEFLDEVAKIKKAIGDSNLDSYVSGDKGKWLSEMLGLNELQTESEVLADNEAGVSNSVKDRLRDIIDNLDTFRDEDGNPKEFYLTYQIDSNSRWSVRETVANPQADKVIARSMMMNAGDSALGYEIGSVEQQEDTAVHMVNELGFKADSKEQAKEQYAKAIEIVGYTPKSKEFPNVLKELKEKYPESVYDKVLVAKALASMEDYSLENVSFMINQDKIGTNKNPLDGKGGKKTLTTYAIIQGIRTYEQSNGERTTFEPEFDAQASGVMNTLMDMVGSDKGNKNKPVQKLLEKLGVKFGDTPADIDISDAYMLLAEIVDKFIKTASGDQVKSKGKEKEIEIIKQLESLGVDIRDMAKYPVMTWFYSAGSKTITRELADGVLKTVVSKGIKADKVALEHLSWLVGRELQASDVQKIRRGDKDYNKIRQAYIGVGTVYQERLDKAFPEVSKYKDRIEGLYEEIYRIAGPEFMTGQIDSPLKQMFGESEGGDLNIFKEKPYLLDLSEAKGGQLEKDKYNSSLVTGTKRQFNKTSLRPILAHMRDALQQLVTEATLQGKYKGKDGTRKLVHDMFKGKLAMLEIGKKAYDQTIVTSASETDMMESVIDLGKSSLEDMSKLAKGMEKGEARDEVILKIKKLKKVLDGVEEQAVNERAYKKELLTGVKVDLFGGTNYEVKGTQATEPTENSKKTSKATEERRTADEVLVDEAKKAKYGYMLDVETGLDGENVWQVAYGKKSKIVRSEEFTAKEYYGEEKYNKYDGDEVALANAYSEYMSLAEVNELIRNEGKDNLSEVVDDIVKLAEDKPIVGFNSNGFDIQKLFETNEVIANVGSIDIRELLKDYKRNKGILQSDKELNKGTQSDYAALLGIDISDTDSHNANYDVEILQQIVNAIAEGGMEKVEGLGDIKSASRLARIDATKNKLKDNISTEGFVEYLKTIAKYGAGNRNRAAKMIANIKAKNITFKLGKNEGTEIDTGANEIRIGTKEGMLKGTDTMSQILEVIGHEVEHAVSANYVEELANKNDAKYNYVVKVLKRAKGKDIGGRLGYVLSQETDARMVVELLAILKGETKGSEELLESLRKDAKVPTGIVSKIAAVTRNWINNVRLRFSEDEVTLEDALSKESVEGLIVAVEAIHNEAEMSTTATESGESYSYKEKLDIVTPTETFEKNVKNKIECKD